MKTKEQLMARKLRRTGVAMSEIANKLGVAKSSVSYWVRDVRLSKKLTQQLKVKCHSIETIEKRRVARLNNTDVRRAAVKKAALEKLPKLIEDPLWCLGIGLYWGEGSKTQQTARIANSDPYVIALMMEFFRKTCEVPEQKFRGHVHTFAHTNADRAEAYWSKISGIPRTHLYKSYIKKSSASLNKRHTLPYGTFQIYVHDSDFFFTLMAWIDYIKKQKSW